MLKTLLKYEKYIYAIFIIGIVIYFPIFFNGFVWDDLDFIINNPQVHQLNFSILFGNNMFNSGPFYRVIPAIYFATVYTFFGEAAFYYHILQLLLHIVDTILLLIFFRSFFSKNISFFLALIFLVHPINVESVAYIGSTQSELYFLPGISALILATSKTLSRNRLMAIAILLLICALTKETGFLFMLLLLVYRYLFKLKQNKEIFSITAIVIIIYSLLRNHANGITYKMGTFIPIAGLSLSQRLLNIPSIIVFYLKTFIFPLNLAVWQIWTITTISFYNFILPTIVCILFFLSLLWIAYFFYKKEKIKSIHQVETNTSRSFQQFIFFLCWFVLGLGLLLQIVPLDMTVAERWFYFPIVGGLGVIGVAISTFQQSSKYYSKLLFLITVFILSMLSIRTFIRTFDYKNNLTLYSHDTHEEGNNIFILGNLSENLAKNGDIDAAIYYQKRIVVLSQTVATLNELGTDYEIKKNYPESIAAFKKAIAIGESKNHTNQKELAPYMNLASVLLLQGNIRESINFIQNKALKEFPNNADLSLLLEKAKERLREPQASPSFKINPAETSSQPNSS